MIRFFKAGAIECQMDKLFQTQMKSFGYKTIDCWSKRNRKDRPSARISGPDGVAFAKLIDRKGLSQHFVQAYERVQSIHELKLEFRRLRIPKVFVIEKINDDKVFIITEFLEGSGFEDKWDAVSENLAGGKALSLITINLFIQLVSDLKTISADLLPPTATLGINKAEEEVGLTKVLARFAHGQSWISSRESKAAVEFVKEGIKPENLSTAFPSNGDFQFRNFIELDLSSTGLVDLDGFRFSNFEAEHCIAYQWALMWNNPKWQRNFIQEAKKTLNVNKELLQGIMIVKTLYLAKQWQHLPEASRKLITNFRRVLNDYESIWN